LGSKEKKGKQKKGKSSEKMKEDQRQLHPMGKDLSKTWWGKRKKKRDGLKSSEGGEERPNLRNSGEKGALSSKEKTFFSRRGKKENSTI